MPEGHSVHRIARQFRANYVGERAEVSSPQGRFALGAARVSGHEVTGAIAVGKQMFLEFEERDWVRVHLGIYGAWDFAGEVRIAPGIDVHDPRGHDREGEDSLHSIGAPRRTRVRMAEHEAAVADERPFPPPPIGQVRMRVLTDRVCADLRGPTVCEVLTADGVAAVRDRLGPDPANDDSDAECERFLDRAIRRRTPIGVVLMDQSVVAGIGNVYRAELLFRAGINPHTPANRLGRDQLRALWDDWAKLLRIGISVGQMLTIDGLEGDAYARALREREERHWVYKLDGRSCTRCGATIALEMMAQRKLYWCPGCQL